MDLERGHFDLAAFYFGESDTGAHHLWSLFDVDSPRHTPGNLDGLPRVYAALDKAVASLLEASGGRETELTVVSDHGSGGSSDKVLYLNRVLQEAGLLQFKPAGRRQLHPPGKRLGQGGGADQAPSATARPGFSPW